MRNKAIEIYKSTENGTLMKEKVCKEKLVHLKKNNFLSCKIRKFLRVLSSAHFKSD